jgi:hypothetical protein
VGFDIGPAPPPPPPPRPALPPAAPALSNRTMSLRDCCMLPTFASSVSNRLILLDHTRDDLDSLVDLRGWRRCPRSRRCFHNARLPNETASVARGIITSDAPHLCTPTRVLQEHQMGPCRFSASHILTHAPAMSVGSLHVANGCRESALRGRVSGSPRVTHGGLG